MNQIRFLIFFVLLSGFPQTGGSQSLKGNSASELKLALKKLNTLGSVLYVAAHPDDENTRLLSYLANERLLQTVYLSITRGEGGQNLIGKEQGEELGLIRTRELLAAREIDGALQTFSMCKDFGYSKTPEETFTFWDREKALADVVWAIRKYRPDVIITRFPLTGEGGHGHHTASAILALEAFHAAADSAKFSSQLKYLSVWQARRIFVNSFTRNQPQSGIEGHIKLDVGVYNPLLGKSYGEIAAESRSMHKSQGFGVARSRGTLIENFKKLDGDTAVGEIFENINTSWKRVNGGDKIEAAITKAIQTFDESDPSATIDQLVKISGLINSVADDYWKKIKLNEIHNLILACGGIWFEANTSEYFTSPGDSVYITASAISRLASGVKLTKIILPGFDTIVNKNLGLNELFSFKKGIVISNGTRFTQPYWLESANNGNNSNPDSQQMTGMSWNESEVDATFEFEIHGKIIVYTVPFTYKSTDPVKGEIYRPFEIVPAISIIPDNEVLIFRNSEPVPLSITFSLNTDSISGNLNFELPGGWKAEPQQITANYKGKGKAFTSQVMISPLNQTAITPGTIKIVFENNESVFNNQVRRIQYDHIPAIVYMKPAIVNLVPIDLKSKVTKIGYIEGAGDQVASSLRQAGFAVDILDEKTVTGQSLDGYGAIITGIRAYNTIENIDMYYLPLMKYVENGGNLIVQYNTSNFISSVKSMIGPYPFTISRQRVTDENSPVSFIHPNHDLLNKPNKIDMKDFDNWIQERGLYFATEIAPEYETIINWNDPGEKPLDGGIIIAKKGKGNFIYTGISFFRQLPAGVPGAYRLLVNMINAGK